MGGHKGVGARGGGAGLKVQELVHFQSLLLFLLMLLLNASQSLLYLHSFVLAPSLPPPPHSPAVAASTRPMRTSTFDIHLNLHYFLSLYISLLLLLFTVIPILISTALCMGFFPLPLSLFLSVFLCSLPPLLSCW